MCQITIFVYIYDVFVQFCLLQQQSIFLIFRINAMHVLKLSELTFREMKCLKYCN